MKKLLVAIGIISLACLLPVLPAHAVSTEQIDKFDSQIIITPDNTAKIVETIDYNFGDSPHHGIYRDIPIDYKDGNTKYYLNFRLNSVSDGNGSNEQTALTTENGNERIRIGDPNVTITGVHTYQISYELSPLITKLNGRPFLNLDIVGEGWQVPINNISAKVTLSNDAALSSVKWYGADNYSDVANELSVYNLAPYQGVTINASLPDGYVSNYLQPNKPRTEDIISAIVSIVIGVLSGGIVITILSIIILRRLKARSQRKKQIVVAQYEPPEGMSPAQIGLLEDDITEMREITATIIDWAVRGYIKIVYIPKKGFFSTKDYKLVQLKDPSTLPENELLLYKGFFGEAQDIKISAVNKVAAMSGVSIFKQTIRNQLTDKGYYDKAGNLLMRGVISEAGAKEWALVDGFKLYLSVVEKDRLKFTDAPDKTPERFNALLPYAIALGVEKEWAKQFEGIDVQQNTNWYSGNLVAFSAISLASDLGSGLAPMVASNSSVSSSGGGGGGGFGGGGGGSW